MAKYTSICVLKSGGEYHEGHVLWLAKQVPGLVCISDVEIRGIKTIKMTHDWSGWWSKLELFRPDIEGDLLYYDLDTVVIDPVVPDGSCSLMLADFYVPQRSGSGLMYIRHEDKAPVWAAWMRSPEEGMEYKPTRLHHGDQGFIMDYLPHRKWQEFHNNAIMSYKVHVQRGHQPQGVVCFHGQPRPWNVSADWIPPL
jgi:hypothetical protein